MAERIGPIRSVALMSSDILTIWYMQDEEKRIAFYFSLCYTKAVVYTNEQNMRSKCGRKPQK